MKQFAFALAATLAGLALALIALEVLLQYRSRVATDELMINFYAYVDKTGVPQYLPHVRGRARLYDGSGYRSLSLNSLGAPGPEPFENPDRRIVFLGDSVTLNVGVPWQHSFVGRLREKLHAQGCTAWDVLNLGFPDANIAHYLLRFQHLVLPLKPDVAIVGLYLNDSVGLVEPYIEDFVSKLPTTAHAEQLQLLTPSYLSFKLAALRTTSFPESTESRFRWIARYRADKYRENGNQLKLLIDEARYDWGGAWHDEHWSVVRSYLKQMKELADFSGIELWLLLLPARPQVVSKVEIELLDVPQERAREIAEQLELPLIDPLSLLREHASEGIFHDHCHLSPKGNALVAEALLSKMLTTEEFISGGCRGPAEVVK